MLGNVAFGFSLVLLGVVVVGWTLSYWRMGQVGHRKILPLSATTCEQRSSGAVVVRGRLFLITRHFGEAPTSIASSTSEKWMLLQKPAASNSSEVNWINDLVNARGHSLLGLSFASWHEANPFFGPRDTTLVILPFWLLSILFAILPAIRFLRWRRSRCTTRGFAVLPAAVG